MQIYVPEDLKRKQTHVNLLHTCTVDGIEKKKTEKKKNTHNRVSHGLWLSHQSQSESHAHLTNYIHKASQTTRLL